MTFRFLLAVAIYIFPSFSFAGGDHQAKEGPKIKKGAAVTEFSEEDGFKLSPRALMNLGVSFTTLGSHSSWVLPKSALISIKRATGVYRMWDNWITMVFVDIVRVEGDKVYIKSVDLEPGDQVAVTGAAFLRMTDADLNSETVDSCTH